MGLFSKKRDNIYSLEKALELLKTEKYRYYTTVPVGNGFKIVPETEVSIYSESIDTNEFKIRRGKFLNGLSQKEEQGNIGSVQNYNNYQSAKRYQNSSSKSLGR